MAIRPEASRHLRRRGLLGIDEAGADPAVPDDPEGNLRAEPDGLKQSFPGPPAGDHRSAAIAAATAVAAAGPGRHSFMDKLLDVVERIGNKVPHPVLMFFYLMTGVIVLSAILALLGVSVTERVALPVPTPVTPDLYADLSQYTLSGVGTGHVDYVIQERTVAIRSLLSIDGIRFLFTSFVSNFQGFGALAVTHCSRA